MQGKVCGKKRHTKTEIRSEISELICGRIAAGENYNLTRDNKGNGLAELVNDGDRVSGYMYDYPGSFNQPRPFLDNTIEEIENTNLVEDALSKGLKKRNYDVF